MGLTGQRVCWLAGDGGVGIASREDSAIFLSPYHFISSLFGPGAPASGFYFSLSREFVCCEVITPRNGDRRSLILSTRNL